LASYARPVLFVGAVVAWIADPPGLAGHIALALRKH
jgi:hypothetical protein